MDRCNCEIELEVVEQDNEIEVSSVTNAVILKGFSPFIKNGTWWEYDTESQTFADTGIKAQGQDGERGAKGDDGFSPSARVETIADGAKVIVTDKLGTTEVDIHNGEKGDKGSDGRDGKDGKDYVITESDYNAIAEITKSKVNVPTKTSELENDSEFITDDALPKLSTSYGTGKSSSGYLQATIKSTSQYESMSHNGIIGKGTLENVLADKGYLTELPIATKERLGVIKVDTSQATVTGTQSGVLKASVLTAEQIATYQDTAFISKGTLNNILADRGYITSDDVPTKTIDFADLNEDIILNCYDNNIVLFVKREGWLYRMSGRNVTSTSSTYYFTTFSSTINRYFTLTENGFSKPNALTFPTTQAINDLIDAKIGALEPLADSINEVIGL